MKKLLELKDVSFRYSEAKEVSLEKVNFTIHEGEVVFIVGDSGSGKSTLLNMINGMIPEVIEGELRGGVLLEGSEDKKIYERSLILGNVFQNARSQFFTTNTTAEFVFQMENYGFPVEEMKRRLKKIVEEYKVQSLLDREIYSLSSGERQFLALLTALIMEPKALLFDEPSANLDYGNAMRLRREIGELKKKGKTIIISDHRAFYLSGLIDKVLLVEDKTVKVFESEEDFIRHDYGRRVFDLFHFNGYENAYKKSELSSVRLEGVFFGEILRDVSFRLNKGEVTVLLGKNGAGKTTLARLISKIIKPDKGETDGFQKALYIMQDADFQLFGATCMKELEISSKDRKKNEEALELLRLSHLKENHPQMLSGGEKQRLQMAIAFVSEDDVIILDEPTSGLDKLSMKKVVEMIEILKEKKTIFVISHDYEFIRYTADRILYLKEGRIEKDFYLDGAEEELNTIFMEMEKNYEE